MDGLLDDIEQLIRDYYREILKDYKFDNQDAEDSVWVAIDDMITDVKDTIKDKDSQIDCELTDNAKREGDSDMESFIYNCQL